MVAQRLQEARRRCAERAWVDARILLHDLAPGELAPGDHELLAVASGLTGEDELSFVAWERAHHAWLAAGDVPRAVRCAVWLGLSLVRRAQAAPAAGWFARAGRLLDDSGIECAEQARLLVPQARMQLGQDPAQALELFTQASVILSAHPDPEVAALVHLGAGEARIALGDVDAGARLLDEAMVAATTGDVVPIAVGIVYCAVIQECHRIFDVRRAREWTVELDRWSQQHQGLVPFRGQCLVHRSEMAQARGDWDDAVQEVESACAHFGDPAGEPAMGLALYQRAELHRLRGEFAAAEDSYQQALRAGHRDVPGRQLAHLGQGRVQEAARSITAALDLARGPVQRGRVLAAHVDIMVEAGEPDAARESADELRSLAESSGTELLEAVAATALGRVEVAAGRHAEALAHLHEARTAWQELGMPYEVARVHALIAEAALQTGDEAAADSARAAARSVFLELGAAPDLERLDRSDADAASVPGGLSPREVEVLAVLATGVTNKQIAQALVISEKTVARHVSNIFTKLGVQSRTAASAWAWEHGMAG